ncbi:hypothetical protein BHE97_02440 [Aeromicrobium sp. PE09-221]|uniref:hypothetical protein n=1 Tax=Aeromicrobium sp. PE09-221 TaxID=1898043 RepID=UPI000B3ED987|nr:hypothetical protein [Aeromicrobium sp. PE09-221]OUZ12573.1 hypothetical protein BHE97_02440 [Aeromicrobium sp. PE09-221]
MISLLGEFAVLSAMLLPAMSPPDIELSPGGGSASVTEPLFDPDVRWVPGDVWETNMVVRNAGPTVASARFRVLVEGDEHLHGEGMLWLDASIDGGPWRTVEWSTWTPGGTLEAGESIQVELRGSFHEAATNRHQDSSVDLEVVWQAAGPRSDMDGLPGAGAVISPWWIVLGLFAVSLGSWMYRLRQER